ncbi:MAG: hypothetical protein CMK07_16250 [Ponticaulis sp.]|nr:hypothetical protein [Ponticaulis sp.]
MLRTLQLILPALIPSWNFFDVIAPSPRIEYTTCNGPDDTRLDWQPFRPRPEQITLTTMLRRLVWNPRWNESLFLVSCAERLSQDITPDHSAREITTRLRRDLALTTTASHFRFRLVFIHREGTEITSEVIYISAAEPIS